MFNFNEIDYNQRKYRKSNNSFNSSEVVSHIQD